MTNYSNAHIVLQTIRVKINNGNDSKEIRALIDSGSQKSYILKATASQLKLVPIRHEKMIHSLFGGNNTAELEHKCYNIKLETEDTQYCLEVLDQERICNDVTPIPTGPWIAELTDVSIKINDVGNSAPIELLIGADVLGKIYTGRKHTLGCGLVAMETVFGWTLMGKIPQKQRSNTSSMIVISLFSQDMSLTNLWEIDVLGISEPSVKKSRDEAARAAKDFFLETVGKDREGRYEVRLPWLEGHPPLPNNYSLAKKRLNSTVQKLKRDGIFESLTEVFEEWVAEGIIEEVPISEVECASHYLPHRPVIKEGSTTRIRPVFDASAREKGNPSLNHCLEKGPNLIELIPSILVRFREHKIGVVSDIRKAFLQISIHEKDRNFLRFLWVNSEGKEVVFRHRRVVFGVNSSPFLLGATIDHHLSEGLKQYSEENSVCSVSTLKKL
ncbi:uncharacterized protein LOC112904277 [Agrilus planipennis]|uniref:Uncharacterized protein LOC112904277 n=1 Tax=Agrilus planipennis TaxID=224129 RepID=A0A7F5QX17_AGRPL|nr:uncharacterized protein LOC112904277 [Agrilus planipennis]